MKRIIRINPINIPVQNAPILLEMMDNDLFYIKAKKQLAEQLKDYDQNEFVFYSKSRNKLVNENDRVSKLFLNKDQNEIEFYLTSYLIKQVVFGGQANVGILQQGNNNDNNDNNSRDLENKIQELKLENNKLQNQLKLKQEKIDQQGDNLIQLENYEKQFKKQLKEGEEFRVQMKKKYEDILQVNLQLKNDLKNKEDQIEEFKFQQVTFEAEKKYLQEQNKRENYYSKQSTVENDNQMEEIILELEKFKKMYEKEKFERLKITEILSNIKDVQIQQKNNVFQKLEEINQTRNQTEYDIINLREELKRSVETCRQFKEQTIQQRKEIFHLEDKFKRAQEKNTKLEEELQNKNEEIQKLKKIIEEKQQDIYKQNLLIEKNNHSNNLQETQMHKLTDEISNLKQQLENETKNINKLQLENESKSIEIEKLEKQIKAEIEKLEILKQQFRNQFEKLEKQLETEIEKQKQIEQKKTQLIKRIKENVLRKVKIEKIISCTENLFKNCSKPLEFLKLEGIMISDLIAEVQIIRVDNNKALQSLTNYDDPNIAEFIVMESLGNWEIKKSIAINGDGTKRKGFLMQVMKCEKNLYDNQVFIIKQLEGYEKIVNKFDALYVAQNSLIAKILAEHFQEKIQKASIKPPCKFAYNDPYLLKIDGNYYIAERLIKGNFLKFDQETDIGNYFQAFQIFTYLVTQKMLMVSNIQGNFNGSEYILCDPIISSPEGILGDEDLGEQLIDSLQETNECVKNYLQSLGILHLS
ncbi:unnamed protein product [Paramecium pentaurelia]|uniref:Alpha-type protein kinase domain-containing protein n=1 Tax=Paramecium pentaurelia TaxID=43138 RepID=A0A8S1V6C7_9CILI|nr:unnamed protein product [Paramecium pentaurelia]